MLDKMRDNLERLAGMMGMKGFAGFVSVWDAACVEGVRDSWT